MAWPTPGAVVRRGEHVLRPSNPHTGSIHRFLTALRAAGFDGASEPVRRRARRSGATGLHPRRGGGSAVPRLGPDRRGVDLDRRPAPPVPRRRARAFDPSGEKLERRVGRPGGGPIVVPRRRVPRERRVQRRVGDGPPRLRLRRAGASGLRPGAMVRMCGPVDDELSAGEASVGTRPTERPALRLARTPTGWTGPVGPRVAARSSTTHRRGGQFVIRRVEAGDPNFIAMWEQMGGRPATTAVGVVGGPAAAVP